MLPAFVIAAGEDVNPLIPALPDLFWGTICFLIVLGFFLWYALPRINATLDARRDAIEGDIARAGDAQRQAEASLAEYTAQLADARREAGEIRDAAREDGKKIIAEARVSASAEASRIGAAAQSQIEAERQAALVSLKGEVGTLAIDLASNVVGEALTDDQKSQAVVDRFLAELEESERAASGKPVR